MHKMTEENLKAAFAGESQAHMRYLIYADVAEKEYPNIARMFRAISYAEQIHATKHFKNLSGINGVADNLAAAIGGETFEVEEMYPAYHAVAELQSEKGALQGIDWALEAEKIHAKMYANAKSSVDAGSDVSLGSVYVCSVCGFTGEGEAPDNCPVCKAIKAKFRTF